MRQNPLQTAFLCVTDNLGCHMTFPCSAGREPRFRAVPCTARTPKRPFVPCTRTFQPAPTHEHKRKRDCSASEEDHIRASREPRLTTNRPRPADRVRLL